MQEKIKRLSENLKRIRIKNELTISQIAQRLNVTEDEYEKLETGVLSPTINVNILFYAEQELGIEAYKLLM